MFMRFSDTSLNKLCMSILYKLWKQFQTTDGFAGNVVYFKRLWLFHAPGPRSPVDFPHVASWT